MGGAGRAVRAGAAAGGSESRDDDDEVSSGRGSAVEELELAAVLACGCRWAGAVGAVRVGAAVCDGAPVSGGAG